MQAWIGKSYGSWAFPPSDDRILLKVAESLISAAYHSWANDYWLFDPGFQYTILALSCKQSPRNDSAMKNILVALDMKSTDAILLDQAASLAHKCGSRIWMVHVASPDPDFVGFEMGPKYIRDFVADELRTEHRQLQAYAEDLQHKSLEAEGLLIQGPTIEMIEGEVKKLNIDLLILGSHKHGFLYETFVGNTAFQIIREVSIPVMIIPLPNE